MDCFAPGAVQNLVTTTGAYGCDDDLRIGR